MLHILDGDSSANTLRQSSVEGDIISCREALVAGPAPASVEGEEWLQVRARHLSSYYGVPLSECEQGLRDQEIALASYPEHDEVVLWFEHDLFCETNLLYLLNWFASRELGTTKLSLICIGGFPGIAKFRGLGQLNAEQLVSLFPSRHEVSSGELKLATAGWAAYRSPDPTEIEKLLEGDTSAMPFLRPALEAHLRRFPSMLNGLGGIENTALRLIQSGVKKSTLLFPAFFDAEPAFGLGDFQFWLALKGVSDTREPLLQIAEGTGAGQRLSSKEIRDSSFEITEVGKAVLTGEADFVALNGIDLWLGGVHLYGQERIWRWNETSGKLVFV